MYSCSQLDRFEFFGFFVKESQFKGAKVQAPGSVIDFDKSDSMSDQDFTDEDQSSLPSDLAVRPDPSYEISGWIFYFGQARWKWPRRRLVVLGWGLHGKGLVGPFLVVFCAKPIKRIFSQREKSIPFVPKTMNPKWSIDGAANADLPVDVSPFCPSF